MSRSYRHSPWIGMGGGRHASEKEDKRMANRCLRHNNKIRVLQEKEPLIMKEIVDVWSMSKDGKMYIGKESQINKEWRIKLMRK